MVDLTVVLLTWNRRYLVNHVLYNVLRNKFPFKLVIIDNGSTDGTAEYLQEHKDEIDELILNKRNMGCVAINDAIRKYEGSYVSIQADDNILPFDYLEKMYIAVKTVEANIKHFGFMCSANMVAYPKRWYKKPMTFEEWLKQPIKRIPWKKRWLSTTVTKTFHFGKVVYQEAKAVGTGGTIIPIRILKKVGLFRFYLGGAGEGLRGIYNGEWNNRVKIYGLSSGYILNTGYIHVRETYLRPRKYKLRKVALTPSPNQRAKLKRDLREDSESAKKGISPPSVPKL